MTVTETISAIVDALGGINSKTLTADQVKLLRLAEGHLTLLESSLNNEPLDEELQEHLDALAAA